MHVHTQPLALVERVALLCDALHERGKDLPDRDRSVLEGPSSPFAGTAELDCPLELVVEDLGEDPSSLTQRLHVFRAKVGVGVKLDSKLSRRDLRLESVSDGRGV